MLHDNSAMIASTVMICLRADCNELIIEDRWDKADEKVGLSKVVAEGRVSRKSP
jgi:hypothetical protein